MIKEITQYVENESDFEIGTDLFAGFTPEDALGDLSVLIESGGVPNFFLPDSKTKTIQVLTKSSDYHTARDNANEIYAILHGKAGITLPEVVDGTVLFANTIEAVSEPQCLGQDEKGRFIFSTNFVIKIQNA